MTPQSVGSLIGLRPEYRDRYVILHRNVFPAVLDRIARSNIRNYSIFLTDDILFSYFEHVGSDYAADMAAIAADPRTTEWWQLTDPMQCPFPERTEGEWWMTLRPFRASEAAANGGIPARRIAFAWPGASSAGAGQSVSSSGSDPTIPAGVMKLRLFDAPAAVYGYIEVTAEVEPGAMLSQVAVAIGLGQPPVSMTEVFHTDGAVQVDRKKVFVSGCFDMLHSGHVAFLQEAATLGDVHVGIGSDATVAELKGRHTVCSQDERKYMIDALACVTECRVNRGRGILDFEPELRHLRPDMLVTNEDGHAPAKEDLCRRLGIEYRVLRRIPQPGLPARSTTALRAESTIPYRIDLAGGWLDQPFVSRFYPGAVLTISIEPTVEFNDRSGMASSTRRRAVQLWGGRVPDGDLEHLARLLFSFENPPGTREVAGSQDALGIVLPGLNRLYYEGGYWPTKIESVTDEDTLAWIEQRLHLVTLGPRTDDYVVIEDTHIDVAGAHALAVAADECWTAIRARDLVAFGAAFRASFEAQITMFPRMLDGAVAEAVERYTDRALGWKVSGAGGGGYLILVSETPIPSTLQIKARRRDGT